MTADDATLNARAIAGDRVAFGMLVARHEQGLRVFLSRLAGASDADDLAQETFLRAWQRARQYDTSGSYRAWLARIGWRLFLDQNRRSAAQHRRDERAGDLLPQSAPHTGDLALDLAAALAALSPAERASILLCEGQGWTHNEAAAILDLPLGTLKSIAARAKVKLRKALGYNEGQTP